MRYRLTMFGKVALIVGSITLLLLFIMNTEVHLHPFSIHIHKAEKLIEAFIEVCAFLFFDYHGRWEGFKEGSVFTLDLIKRENEKRENEEVDKGYDVEDADRVHSATMDSTSPEPKEGEKIRKYLLKLADRCPEDSIDFMGEVKKEDVIAWLKKQGEQNPTLPKWKYKKDHTPLLRDSLILNKYGGVAKSPSGAIVSDVWVIDYDELAKLPKEEPEKQCEPNPAWSEEDRDLMYDTLSNLTELKDLYGKDYGKVGKCIDWFRSLKGRVQPQWEPSDEQIKAIRLARSFVVDDFSEHPALSEILMDLEEQLQKIKENKL